MTMRHLCMCQVSQLHFQLRIWNGRREDFLAAGSCIVPERMGKVIIAGQPLVITDELQTIPVNRSINSWIPTLCCDTYIFEK